MVLGHKTRDHTKHLLMFMIATLTASTKKCYCNSFPALLVNVLDFAKITPTVTYTRVGRCLCRYLEVVSGIWIFIAGNDLGGHPVRRSNEGVSPAHRSVQLSADTKIHCGSERQHGIAKVRENLSNPSVDCKTLNSFRTSLNSEERKTGPETFQFDLCWDQ